MQGENLVADCTVVSNIPGLKMVDRHTEMAVGRRMTVYIVSGDAPCQDLTHTGG